MNPSVTGHSTPIRPTSNARRSAAAASCVFGPPDRRGDASGPLTPAARSLACLLFLGAARMAPAQDTVGQFRPELDVYINAGSRGRLVFEDRYGQTPRTDVSESAFAGYFELALRPLFRRALRSDPDVFRSRYLTFRAGYQYSEKVSKGVPSWENRLITELTARYPLKWGFVLIDRNRGDYRFVQNQAFSTRYRNRLWVERPVTIAAYAFTPYFYDEGIYDTRYDAWSLNRLAAGLRLPIGKHVVPEPYFMRQLNTQANPRHTNAIGFKLNLYF